MSSQPCMYPTHTDHLMNHPNGDNGKLEDEGKRQKRPQEWRTWLSTRTTLTYENKLAFSQPACFTGILVFLAKPSMLHYWPSEKVVIGFIHTHFPTYNEVCRRRYQANNFTYVEDREETQKRKFKTKLSFIKKIFGRIVLEKIISYIHISLLTLYTSKHLEIFS